MFRWAHILVTIAFLLICPIRCVSAATSTPSGVSVRQKCACCRHKVAPKPASEQKSPPVDDCGCGSCLCHGALRVTVVDAIDLGAVAPAFSFLMIVPECTTERSQPASASERTFDFKRLDGQSTRIAFNSWLC